MMITPGVPGVYVPGVYEDRRLARVTSQIPQHDAYLTATA